MEFQNVKVQLADALGGAVEWIDCDTSEQMWDYNTSIFVDDDGQQMRVTRLRYKPIEVLVAELQRAKQIGIRGPLVYFNE